MDIRQAEKMESQHAAFLKYENSISLSKSKVAFGRRVDEKSIVLRNLYPKIEDLQTVFLLIGEDHIETLFYSLLSMMKEKMATLQRTTKYVKKSDFDEILRLIEEKQDKINGLGRLLREKQEMKNDGLLIRFPTGDDGICVKIFANSNFPAIRFINESKEKDYCNSCDLFIGEAIRLLRYLNSRFNFSETNILKTKTYQILNRPDLFGCM